MFFLYLNFLSTLIYHPLDQFEMIVLFFHWSGILMPVGPAIVTNLTMILLLNVFYSAFFLLLFLIVARLMCENLS